MEFRELMSHKFRLIKTDDIADSFFLKLLNLLLYTFISIIVAMTL